MRSSPAATVAALARADERLEREFGRITLPVFILHGIADSAASADVDHVEQRTCRYICNALQM